MTNIWKYATNGAISSDGLYQLSGVDRDRYLVRFRSEFVLIPSENFTTDHEPKAALYLSQPLQWMTETGPRKVSMADKDQLRAFLAEAFPIMGRTPIFE